MKRKKVVPPKPPVRDVPPAKLRDVQGGQHVDNPGQTPMD